MVRTNETNCPICGGELKYHDRLQRIVRTKRRETEWVWIRRLQCQGCGRIHRELPPFIFPYKQYDAEVIQGVIEGLITSETMGYEDYPCEMTMIRWKTQNLHLLL